MINYTYNAFSNELVKVDTIKRMVQYGVWPNCPNSCDFCLLKEKNFYTKDKQLYWLHAIEENVKTIDWNQFPYGISLLGGELYYVKDEDVKIALLSLIDTIIDYVLLDSLKQARFSTVTNGLYEPSFLFQILDRIVNKRDITRLDINFSYDLKYRYKNETARVLVLKNIQKVCKRYNYKVGVQMILTQNVINLWKENKFDINKFLEADIPNCNFAFLYPHKIHTGKILNDFFFNRKDFLQFVQYLRDANYEVYSNFVNSVKNSAIFKYTGLHTHKRNSGHLDEIPILSDDKEIITDCGHSILYRCYSDSDKCMLCDLMSIDGEL